jgi:hypothetical protein
MSQVEERLDLLSIHYHNELLYNVKLRDALNGILSICKDETDASVIALSCRALVERALAIPPPPNPTSIGHEKGYGFLVGHPAPEYLHLPMRPTDEYVDPSKD